MHCKLCGHDEEWHRTNHPRHPFNGELQQKATPSKVKVVQGGDPVLRLALVQSGILSYEQLALAEEKLRNAQASGEPIIASSHTDHGSETAQHEGSNRSDL